MVKRSTEDGPRKARRLEARKRSECRYEVGPIASSGCRFHHSLPDIPWWPRWNVNSSHQLYAHHALDRHLAEHGLCHDSKKMRIWTAPVTLVISGSRRALDIFDKLTFLPCKYMGSLARSKTLPSIRARAPYRTIRAHLGMWFREAMRPDTAKRPGKTVLALISKTWQARQAIVVGWQMGA
jgi:hypothetical protein